MGTFIGHVLPGAGFFLLGLWHLYSTVSSHVRSPYHFKARTWFPLPHRRLRHLELYFIILGSLLSISAELFICPKAHQPWSPDWSIPSYHLNNFEHSTISLFMLLYAALTLLTDVTPQFPLPQGWTHALAALALSQELLLFHFHSADHIGLEGHCHWLLQLPIAVAILTLVVEIFVRTLPVVSIARSMSILFQGTWFIQMGIVLWTPSMLPKGCRMVENPEHVTVQCATEEETHSAKALTNLWFSWHLAAIVAVTAGLLLGLAVMENRRTEYRHLEAREVDESVFKIVEEDLEHGNGESPHGGGSQHSMEMETFDGLDLER